MTSRLAVNDQNLKYEIPSKYKPQMCFENLSKVSKKVIEDFLSK